MEKRDVIYEIKTGLKISARILILTGLIGGLGFVFYRTHPKWKDSEIVIEPANRYYEVECLDPEGDTLETRILTPEGYTRVPAEKGSFTEYLRNYPLLPDDIDLPTFAGQTIHTTDVAAVFDISLEKDGYQQCADSVIRLYSDYFYENGQFDKISFQFSNGDVCDYNRWRKGKRMFAFAGISCELPAALPDDSEQQYKNYLKEVMRYAGTISLQNESVTIPADDLRVGDIICNNTHVVMVIDEAVNEEGKKSYLIGQSFIPSVCFHALTHTDGEKTDPWYSEDYFKDGAFELGYILFEKDNIRRWKDGF